jgi:fatty acid-binding protein DegV
VQALAGALLNIKPIIGVDHNDGKYNTLAKSRTIPRALKNIADQLQSIYIDTPLWITVMHGRFAEQAETLAQELRGRMHVARLEILRISPVLGVHTGPGIVGAAVVPMHLFEDI